MITEKTYPFAKKESIILNFCKNAKSKIVVIHKKHIYIVPLFEYNFLNTEKRELRRMRYLSTFQVAEKWGISHRRVNILCNQERIPGAQKAGSRWIIPEDAEKPVDARIKSGKYVKAERTKGGIQ